MRQRIRGFLVVFLLMFSGKIIAQETFPGKGIFILPQPPDFLPGKGLGFGSTAWFSTVRYAIYIQIFAAKIYPVNRIYINQNAGKAQTSTVIILSGTFGIFL